VPAGLRDPERPDLAWAPAFLELGATATDRQTFRTGLAALLQGAAEQANGARAAAADRSATPPSTPGLLDRLANWVDHVTAIFFPLAGLACVVWIERRRFSAVHDTR